jgi:PAS domain-containing protein
VPSRTRPGANFRRLRARQSKGTSRLVGRDSRQSETLGRTRPAQRHQSSRSTSQPRRSCESRGSPPAGRCPRNLGEDGLATQAQFVELAPERGPHTGPRVTPGRRCARNHRGGTSIWPSSFTTGQPGGARAGGRSGPSQLESAISDLNGGRYARALPPPCPSRRRPGKAEAITDIRREAAASQDGGLQHAIFNSANFSSIATDEKGVIQLFNVGAERMLGYTAAECWTRSRRPTSPIPRKWSCAPRR